MLEKMFYPASVAVIGASHEKRKVGRAVLDNLLEGFKGKIYPVNPKADEIAGLKCYKSVLDIPDSVDLAVIVIPSKLVPMTTKECGEKGIKYLVIISAGFKEAGVEGAKLENEVKNIAKSYGIRIVGPNCLGIINTFSKCNASFAKGMPPHGNISIMTQSGALGTAILDWSQLSGVGFSNFVSMGNKADLNESDFMESWQSDEHTKVILAYLEGITDGRRFIDVARVATKSRPVLIIKSGRTGAGARAVSSHTGSLAGSDAAYDSAFLQSGVIRTDTMNELFDAAACFSDNPIPPGDRVAIVTNAGGPGIMATDACERYGMKLASLSSSTIDGLKAVLPAAANFYNPVDVLGDATQEVYEKALRLVIDDPGVDMVLALLTPQAMTDAPAFAKVVESVKRDAAKPLIPCFMGGLVMSAGVNTLKDLGLYNFDDPARAAYALRTMVRYNRIRSREYETPKRFDADMEMAKRTLEAAKKGGGRVLGLEAMPMLEAYGIPTIPYRIAADLQMAKESAAEIGYPVVMKIMSPQIVHKSDVGGVRVGIDSPESLEAAYIKMMKDVKAAVPKCQITGVLIQKMAMGGKEVIIGMNRDPQFGPLMMFGLGGVYVELLRDVQFRVAPLTEKDAMGMIYGIKAHQLLEGARGEKRSDVEKLSEIIQRLSQMVMDFPEIVELDVNPVKVYEAGKGCMAIDVRMTVL